MTFKKILLTGFGPFGGADTNPAMQLVHALDDQVSDAYRVYGAILPVERYRAIECLKEKIDEIEPDLVILLGVAVGRENISLEKVAINFDDFRIPDNGGNQPIGEAIKAEGPAAYFSTLPINRMREVIAAQDIPVEISFSAGTYVCNHIMYGALHHCDANALPLRTGFIHIPQSEEDLIDPTKAALPFAQMKSAIICALETAAKYDADVARNAGDTH